MTVAELVHKLKSYDDDTEVAVTGSFGGMGPLLTLVMVNYDPETRTGWIHSADDRKKKEIRYLHLSSTISNL